MSGLVEFKLEGLSDLQTQLARLGTDGELGRKALAQAARKAFQIVLASAKGMVPVYSGALREALKLTVKKPKGGDAVVVVGIYVGKGAKDSAGGRLLGRDELPPARRWHFVELGTAFMAAHPFLRPALDANADAVLGLLKTELAKSIARIQRKGR